MLTETEKHERNLALLRFIGWTQKPVNNGITGEMHLYWFPPNSDSIRDHISENYLPDLLGKYPEEAEQREMLRDKFIGLGYSVTDGVSADGDWACTIDYAGVLDAAEATSENNRREPFIDAAHQVVKYLRRVVFLAHRIPVENMTEDELNEYAEAEAQA